MVSLGSTLIYSDFLDENNLDKKISEILNEENINENKLIDVHPKT